MFLLYVNAVLLIAHVQQPMRVLQIEDSKEMTRSHVCNTHFHISFVIASMMFIQLMCSIQAFRGRHLPSIMNDAMMLTYLTFILTISFAVSFVMVYFQSLEKKETFQTCVIVCNNFIICLMMYGQKVFRMLAYPKKNTRVYFQELRMRNVNDSTPK